MQGLAPLQHHVVGHVDDVGDGPHAGLGQALGHPAGGRSRRPPARSGPRSGGSGRGPRRPAWRDRGRCRSATAGRGKVNGTPRAAARSRATPAIDMASGRLGVISRSKTMSSRPRTVRRSSPERRVGRQDHDPAVVVGQAELVGGAEHPVRPLLPDPAPFELEPAGQLGPGRRPGDDVADDVVVGPAHHPDGVAVAGVDVDQRQPVGVGVLLDRQHLDGPDAGDVTARGGDALDDEADLVEQVGQLERGCLRWGRSRGARRGGPSRHSLTFRTASGTGRRSRRTT